MPHKAHNFRYVKKMCFVRNGDSLRLLQTVITTTRVAWGNSFLHCVSWGHCFVFVPSGLLYYNFPKNRKIHVHEVFCLKWCIYMICCWVTKLYLSLCNPMDCSTPGFSVPHHLLEFAQAHVHWNWWCHPSSSFSVTLFSTGLSLVYHLMNEWVSLNIYREGVVLEGDLRNIRSILTGKTKENPHSTEF